MQNKSRKRILNNNTRDWLACLFGSAGFIAVLLAAGTDDYRFSSEYNPEKDKIASTETTTAMALGGTAALLGATILLVGKKEYESR